jgi:hypothetical protein
MPLGYHINPDDGLITVQGHGEVDVDEITRLGEALLHDAAYDPALPQLLDFRGLRPRETDGDVSQEAVEELWSFIQESYRARVMANVAVVIDEHLESQHCADIFLLTCAIQDAELFADYDQALKWLMRRAFAGGDAVVARPPEAAADPASSGEQEDARGDHANGAPE